MPLSPSSTILYLSVGEGCSAAGKVIVGTASQWLYFTDFSALTPSRLRHQGPGKRELPTYATQYRSMAPLTSVYIHHPLRQLRRYATALSRLRQASRRFHPVYSIIFLLTGWCRRYIFIILLKMTETHSHAHMLGFRSESVKSTVNSESQPGF